MLKETHPPKSGGIRKRNWGRTGDWRGEDLSSAGEITPKKLSAQDREKEGRGKVHPQTAMNLLVQREEKNPELKGGEIVPDG